MLSLRRMNKINGQELKKYKVVQDIARDTALYLEDFIEEGRTEVEIVEAAKKFMLSKGVESFWYHNVPALVLVGDRTLESISGKEYEPSTKKVGKDDLVTVDLSPEIQKYWGDYARSFVVVNGRVTKKTEEIPQDNGFYLGINAVIRLHEKLGIIATPNLTFGDLYVRMNEIIDGFGFINLDFKKNLGHTIEKDKDKRKYIEGGEKTTIREAGLFTFEPHISTIDKKFGYKREDIYHYTKTGLKKL